MGLNIYTNDKDKQWIEIAEKVAAKKDWSLSKVIKFIMKKALIEGTLEIKEEPLIQRVEKKVEESKVEEKKEKISPDDIFKEIEKEQTKEEEKIISNKDDKSMEELAVECKKKELQPSGKYVCHYKDQLIVQYPICVVCWTLEEIWGEDVYK